MANDDYNWLAGFDRLDDYLQRSMGNEASSGEPTPGYSSPYTTPSTLQAPTNQPHPPPPTQYAPARMIPPSAQFQHNINDGYVTAQHHPEHFAGESSVRSQNSYQLPPAVPTHSPYQAPVHHLPRSTNLPASAPSYPPAQHFPIFSAPEQSPLPSYIPREGGIAADMEAARAAKRLCISKSRPHLDPVGHSASQVPPKTGLYRAMDSVNGTAGSLVKPAGGPPSGQPSPGGKFTAYSYAPRDPNNKRFLKDRVDMAKRLTTSDGMKKTTYDPKTIARDVLISAGRHPKEAALNHHLSRLRDVFTHIDTSSDLSTFRWDLVDPVPDETRDQNASAPRPETSAVPPQLPAAQPTPPLPTVDVWKLSTHQPPQHAQQRQNFTPVPASQSPLPQPIPQPYTHPPSPPKPQSTPQPKSQPTPQPKPQPKPQSTPQSKPQRKSQPSPQPVPQAPAPTPPQPYPKPEVHLPTPIVEMGRPPGKRPVGRPPGRPSGSTKVPMVVPPPLPVSYQVYACRWQNCQAELHNLEMLRKHVLKLHVPYSISCAWKGCTFEEHLPAWQLFEHIKTAHLDSIAWKQGDGPSVTGPGEKAS
ncbi:hypothetical protein P168DRAFT_34887 [Aspergillus campestris IBT 28561]|uniref:C2H2-type domain-containing protein n=1 Tax=Aspergillus campestris (strain IBT 28561) TaxID=1392248 RepID=A0A2I1DHI0_ASPC2|nr:uncharacterized protein P168DRAFT_34887 [Aspergillus campestris IBT 28561]PKY09332.1 hypothetical protein P168DRAFT_34887 [Aspergillus campestris IBT 28561]